MTSPNAGVELDGLDQAARRELADLFDIELLHRRGPASIVYLARDRECDRRLVALKVMPRAPEAGPDVQQEFHRAAAASAVVDDPHVALMYSAGTSDSCFWYTSAYVDGPSLAELLRNGPMEVQACLRVVRQVARALDTAHQRHLVHGDLKTANVLVDANGSARVTDFWVPHVLQQLGALGAGVVVRRPEYVSPEERSGGGQPPAPAADQYALAVLLGECLGGHVSPSGVTFLGAGVPQRISLALARALATAPPDRFASIAEFIMALHAPASVSTTPSPLSPLPSPGASAVRRPSPTPPVLLDPAEFDEEVHDPGKWRRRVRIAALALVATAAVGAAWVAATAWLSRPTVAWSGAPLSPPDSGPSMDSLVALLAPAPSSARADTLSPSSRLAASSRPSSRLAASPRPPPPAPPVRRAPPSAPVRTAAPRPPAPGRLFVNATPWGQVYLDGVPIGNTPRVGVSVSAGTHQVRVERDGFVPFERTITVVANGDVRLTDIVLRELRP